MIDLLLKGQSYRSGHHATLPGKKRIDHDNRGPCMLGLLSWRNAKCYNVNAIDTKEHNGHASMLEAVN